MRFFALSCFMTVNSCLRFAYIKCKRTTKDMKAYEIAEKRYNEVARSINGKEYSEDFCNRLHGHNFTDELFDLNYKEICVTILNNNGKCCASRRGVKVWNTGDDFVSVNIYS